MSWEDYENAVKIDDCHVELIKALVASNKPNSILELGFGSGNCANAICDAILENNIDPKYLIVDNWMDFHNREIPSQAKEFILFEADFITSEEKDYIDSCKDTFDFILSDADHGRTNEWMQKVYNDILNPGGILIYHDVMGPEYPNLFSIVTRCRNNGIYHVVFDKNSRPEERCDRGLLVIFKPR